MKLREGEPWMTGCEYGQSLSRLSTTARKGNQHDENGNPDGRDHDYSGETASHSRLHRVSSPVRPVQLRRSACPALVKTKPCDVDWSKNGPAF